MWGVYFRCGERNGGGKKGEKSIKKDEVAHKISSFAKKISTDLQADGSTV